MIDIKKSETRHIRYFGAENTVEVELDSDCYPCIIIDDYEDPRLHASLYGREAVKQLIDVLTEVLNELPVCEHDEE